MLFYPYGIFLQAIALVHFVRRRPDNFWLLVILMGGSIGAFVYILVQVIPDAGLLRGSFQAFPRRKRIKQLEGLIVDNPSVGNYEELGDLLLDEEQFARARECFDKVIAKSDSIDPFYRRALCEMALNDFAAASSDLERVLARDPKYDYHRAAGLRAHALAKLGEREKADALFAEVTKVSTLSEVQYDYACFLMETGRTDEAREWAERILLKKATMPDYIRRRERPWFRKANALLKKLHS
ncbi:MAG TPA: tetratricopeptide repeat protein [Vicinamibacterales bacterium]|nr:tetratricopeptide repeat protein [Vicinamibacterales bacterium]